MYSKDIEDVFPMSDIEKGMVFHSLKEPEKSIYHNQQIFLLNISGFNISLFTKVFSLLINKHKKLRTSYNLSDADEPVQIVHKDVEFNIPFYDISAYPPEQKNAFVESIFIKDKNHPFSFSKEDLLWRFRVALLSKDTIILIWSCHHAIIDGWSSALLVSEIYHSYVNAQKDIFDIKPLKSSYKDFIIEQIIEKKRRENYDFWSSELQNFNSLEFPFKEPVDGQKDKICKYKYNFGNEFLDQLSVLARELKTTLKNICFAAYSFNMSMLSHENNIVVGLVANNRPLCEDGNKIIGCFLNTVPVKIYNQPIITWSEYIKQIDEKLLKIKKYEKLSFFEISKCANKIRKNGNAIFDTIFNFVDFSNADNNFPYNQEEIKEEQFLDKGYENTNTLIDYDINVTSNELQLTITYNDANFTEEFIKRLCSYFKNILNEVITKPLEKISKNTILTNDEKKQLLYDFNNSKYDYPSDIQLLDLFDKQVEHNPDRIAVVDKDKHITYKELDKRSNQFACALREKGVKNNSIVGIISKKDVELTIKILSIFKAGGAYLPIDPLYPEERIKFILNDSQPKITIANSDFIKAYSTETKNFIDYSNFIHSYTAKSLKQINNPDDVAYVIYTSGTTGKPKGVVVQHNNYINISLAWKQSYRLNEIETILLQVASFSFDVFAGDFSRALFNGGKLVFCPENIILEIPRLYDIMVKEKISIIESTPALINLFINYIITNNYRLKHIKLLILGSDCCHVNDFTKIEQYFGNNTRIINSYGVTEATIDSSFYEKSYSNFKFNGNVPIGKPLPFIKFYILDTNLQLLPKGAIGELFIGGISVTRGYLNNSTLTSDKFIIHETLGRLYRSGDYGKWLNDGNMLFLGRKDHQVKIYGNRIELGEINNQLLKYKHINEAVTTVKKINGSDCLVSYFTSSKDISKDDLRDYLSKLLPGFMLPAFYVKMGELPLTSNSKVDINGLPDPILECKTGKVPETEVEKLLAEVWMEVLGLKNISINSNFFELGGDSIKAIQISAKLRKHNIKLEIKDLFLYHTIEKLSGNVKAIERKISQETVFGDFDINPVQQWFFKSDYIKSHYNQAIILSKSEFNVEIVKKVFTEITKHHDNLRSVFKNKGVTVFQCIKDIETPGFELKEYDLTLFDDYHNQLTTYANKLQNSIDIENGPLLKIGLFRTKQIDYLLIIIHHLVVDGISWRIILEDYQYLYEQIENKNDIVLPNKTDSFKTWCEQIKEYSESNTLLNEIDYWKSIEDYPKKALLKDFYIDKEQRIIEFNDKIEIQLNIEYTAKLLSDVNKPYNTKIDEILITALFMAIRNLTGENYLFINLEGHGREKINDEVDISRTIGWFTAQFPVIIKYNNTQNIGNLIKSTKQTIRDIPNKGIGYSILKYITPKKCLAEMVFKNEPEVSFNYLGQFQENDLTREFILNRKYVGDTINPKSISPFSLDINGMIESDIFRLSFEYNKKEFKKESVEKIAEYYKTSIIQIIDYCTNKKEVEITPGDFSYNEISAEDLEMISGSIEELE